MLGLYWDNGKENANYYSTFIRLYVLRCPLGLVVRFAVQHVVRFEDLLSAPLKEYSRLAARCAVAGKQKLQRGFCTDLW